MDDVNLASWVDRVPVSCFWEITDACNLRCIHCEADAGHAAPDELDTDEALALATHRVDRVVVRESIPRTMVGKLDRKALRAEIAAE